MSRLCAVAAVAVVVLAAPGAAAQGEPPTGPPGQAAPPAAPAEDLAKQLTNPIANLVSVPFQFNWNSGVGPENELQFVLDIQPVVPVSLSKDWNLIGRYIVPLVAQPSPVPGGSSSFGMGDIVFSMFLSPASASHLVWGLGPVFGLPTSTDPTIGSGKWLAGPTGVALYLTGPWTAGVLANQLWSFAGTGDLARGGVSQLFVQPFVAYTTGSVTITAMSETSIDWEATDGKWTVPVELLASKLTKIGFLPFSVQLGGGWFVESPTGGPEWRLRLSFVVLLPKKLPE